MKRPQRVITVLDQFASASAVVAFAGSDFGSCADTLTEQSLRTWLRRLGLPRRRADTVSLEHVIAGVDLGDRDAFQSDPEVASLPVDKVQHR